MRAILVGLALLALPVPAVAEPDLEGFWHLAFEGEPDPALLAKLPPGTAVIEDTGVVEFPEDECGGLKLTPEALVKASAWEPADEMMLSRVCLPPSIIYAGAVRATAP